MKSARKRCHNCICYCSTQELLNILATQLSIIERYAFIFHDKDKNLDGSLKEPHTHLVVKFSQPRSISNVREMFTVRTEDVVHNCLDSFTNNEILSLQYLVHKNDIDKYQYPIEEVTAYNLDYIEVYNQDVAVGDTLFNALYDLLSGVKFYELAKKYGRDYIVNHDRLKRLADDIVDQERRISIALVRTIDLQTGEASEENDLISAFEIAQEKKKENLKNV